MTYTLRAALAIGLLIGFYVVALGVVVGLVAVIVGLVNAGLSGAGLAKLAVVFALIAFAIIRGLVTRERTTSEPGGVLIDAAHQPRLWSEVHQLAEAVGTRAPDEIRLVAEVNAAVSEESKLLGLVPGTRRLFIGAPLVAGLTAAEMRSALAHELGHYSGQHTALAPVVYRGKQAIRRVLTNLGPGSWVGKLLGLYGRLYMAVASTVSRRQELEADEFSARLAGRAAAESALAEIAPLGAAWDHFVDGYSGRGAADGLRPDHLFDGFTRLIDDPQTRARMDVIRDEVPDPEASVYDSHPPTGRRIAAIRQLDAPEVLDGQDPTAPATDLFDDADAAFAALEAAIYADSGLTPASWEDVTERSAGEVVARNAAELSHRLQYRDEAPTLQAALDRWSSGAPTGLVETEDLEEERAVLRHLIGDAASHQLVASHRARFALSWSGSSTLVGLDGTEIDLWSDADGDVAAQLARHGIDLTQRLPERGAVEEAAPVDASSDQFVGGIAPVKSKHGDHVLVTMRGVMIRTSDGGDRLTRTGKLGGGGKEVLTRVAQRGVADVEADPRTTFTAYEDIASVQVERFRLRNPLVTITTAAGATVEVRVLMEADDLGDPYGAMEHFLGDRYHDEGEPTEH